MKYHDHVIGFIKNIMPKKQLSNVTKKDIQRAVQKGINYAIEYDRGYLTHRYSRIGYSKQIVDRAKKDIAQDLAEIIQ